MGSFFSAICFSNFLGLTLVKFILLPFIRAKLINTENLSFKKGHLIIANSISSIDPLIISLLLRKKIYFVADEKFFKFKFLFNFIAVSEKSQVHKLLENGETVCLFCEKQPSKNGIIGKFEYDYRDYLAKNIQTSTSLLYISGLWETIFSHLYRNERFTFKNICKHLLGRKSFGIITKLRDTTKTPFATRSALIELSSEIELAPKKNETILAYQFAKRARIKPFNKALIDGVSGKKLNNFTVYSKALALSDYIKELCDENEKYVGVLMPNTPASVVVILAVMFANKVPAMLNFTVSAETQERSIAKANIKHVLTSKKFLHKAKILQTPEMVILEEIASKISKSKALAKTFLGYILPLKIFFKAIGIKNYFAIHNDAVLLFSSGSTAEPKGVRLTHHNFNANLKSFLPAVNMTRKDGIVGNLPLFHSFGMNVCFWIPLAKGIKVAYIPNPLDAENIVKNITDHKLTVITATPTFMQSYMRKMDYDRIKSLRLTITGAERLRDEIVTRFEEINRHSTTVVEGYGCTELSPIVSINLAKNIDNLGKEVGWSHSIGIPMPGICVKIINPETLEEVPANTDGLITVKADTVMKGYLNNKKLTKEVMVNDGFYNTNDIGQMNEDGYIRITGRVSRFSKIAGEMVPHESIEQQIYHVLNSSDAKIVVTGTKDSAKGEKIIVFYTTDMKIDHQHIIKSLRENKIPNLWIPRAENFIQIEEIPLLGSGKLNLGAISKLAKKYQS
ncbi:AMP-binding protein [Lentisphaerota bacterium WC36G]